jgi:hypothetical protein
MASRRRTRGTGGRILPHERAVDNLVPIMGAELTDLAISMHSFSLHLSRDLHPMEVFFGI